MSITLDQITKRYRGTPVVNDPNGWNAVTTLKTTDTVVGTGTAIDAGKVAPVAYTAWIYDVRVADTKGTKIDTNVGGTAPRDPLVVYYNGQVNQFAHKR